MLRRLKTGRRADGINLGALADEITALAGRPVSVVLATDAAGDAVLDVLPPSESDDEPAVTAEQVLRVVAAHVPPPPPVDPLDEVEQALAGAVTVAQLRAVLVRWLAAERRERRRAGIQRRLDG